MAEKLKGTNISSRIVPFTKDDKYATHDEEFGRGGYRSVATVADMNAIPEERRKEGMLVNVVGDKVYKLVNGTFVDSESIYKTTLPFSDIAYRSDKTITADERAEVENIIEQYKAGKAVILVDTSGSPYTYSVISVVQDGYSQVTTFLLHDTDGNLWAYKTLGLWEESVWEVKRKSGVYETDLAIGRILSGDITKIDSEVIYEINTLVSLDKDVLITCPAFEISDNGHTFTPKKLPISFSISDNGGLNLLMSYADGDMISIINIYTVGGYTVGTPWHVARYELGKKEINLVPVYDLPNSKVSFTFTERIQGMHFLEGIITIGNTACRIGETINITNVEKRRGINVMADNDMASLSLFLDYSSSRISLTNIYGDVPSITATDFKLIKL